MSRGSMRSRSVYLWWPNLIGFFRIFTLMVAMYYCMGNPIIAGGFYSASQLLDAVDGAVARRYNQCSKFGALLDMLTDRMSTTCLLMAVSIKDPIHWHIYTLFIVLDLVSHWAQMYSTLMIGGQSHKENNTNPIMKFYYKKPFLFTFCLGNEAYIIGSYLILFFPKSSFVHYARLISFPIFIGKNFINGVQLVQSSNRLVMLDRPKQQ